jgi:Ca2+-transporting ATPase
MVNRSWRLPVWRVLRERKNGALKWIVGGAGVLLVLMLTLPWLRRVFDLGELGPMHWMVAIAAGVLAVSWFEVYKLGKTLTR